MRVPLRWPLRRWRVGVLSAVLGLACIVAGCSSARVEQGTSDSPCFKALPVAASALHVHGHLFWVRLIDVNALPPGSDLRVVASRGSTRAVCLVAFTGTFRAGDVAQPFGVSESKAVIVVVSYPANELLGTVLVTRPGLRFPHTF
jgi:hypothetical protein